MKLKTLKQKKKTKKPKSISLIKSVKLINFYAGKTKRRRRYKLSALRKQGHY